ncbi:MAG: nitronate monooxygenase [Candidatus Omnitrophica bacterium]|nr:nitronate monooxygenase [Candidatus Omnitrophota bacterium]
MHYPIIIQGGMGVGVSNWVLAKAVSKCGHLGVISGTFLDTVFARRLQLGDSEGHLRRAVEHFPYQEVAQRVYDRYYIPGGKSPDAPFKNAKMHSLKPDRDLLELTVVANFAEVFLAKEGHDGQAGVNYLEKIQLPNLASIYGAMLAGIDYIIMGAGIPREIPQVLDRFVNHESASVRFPVDDAGSSDDYRIVFDPVELFGEGLAPLSRPHFLAIISSATLAISLKKKSSGVVNGFVVEQQCAGGHNAPPRGRMQLNEAGEPLYGEKDQIDVEKIRSLGLPFWMAGSYGDPAKIEQALQMGAAGVQIGTPFAFCRESGISEEYKQQVFEKILAGEAQVFTDPKASPTGFPFKVFELEGTISEPDVYESRRRICDLGYLRTAVKDENGGLKYRCPAEPEKDFLTKKGEEKELEGRKCLCNGLLAGIGLAQKRRSGYLEKPIITAGTDLSLVEKLLREGRKSYSAADVIEILSPHPDLQLAPA